MLKKINRINKTRDLQKVYRLGKTVHTAALVIKFNSASKSRIGFVVSNKVSKKAVDRNRIKRVLRNEMRLKLDILPKGDYMIITKPAAKNYDNPQLREDLSKGLNKLILVNKSTPYRQAYYKAPAKPVNN